MNNAQKIHQLSLFALISALAVGGVAVASYIQGSNPSFVAGTPSAKSLVFLDGTDTAIPLVLKKNVGEIHGGMMTAAVSTDSGTIQLGAERKKGPGVYDCILVWDANAINSTVTFFVSAVNITSVAVLAETSSYTDEYPLHLGVYRLSQFLKLYRRRCGNGSKFDRILRDSDRLFFNRHSGKWQYEPCHCLGL
jgi:hypothetical protein